MAHYAFIGENNIVTEVITGRNENEIVNGISDWELYYESKRSNQRCLRTSYNGNIRKNFAGVGYYYDEILDAFIPPQPYASWILNEDTCLWESSVSYPNDGKIYEWNEINLSWDLINS